MRSSRSGFGTGDGGERTYQNGSSSALTTTSSVRFSTDFVDIVQGDDEDIVVDLIHPTKDKETTATEAGDGSILSTIQDTTEEESV